jgi:ubiquinone/menaquinone biosynthesis C-methylase UbiE
MNNFTGGNVLLNVNIILKKSQIGEKMKVADLGCGGSGHFVFPVSKIIGKKGKIYAVDILKPALERVSRRAKQENYLNVETIWSDLEVFGATKIESESLDAAMLINTLHLSHKRVEILREAIRMLKKGGKMIIIDWSSVAVPLGPPPEERVEINSLKKATQKLGLSIVDEFEPGFYHYGLIFTKI